MLVILRVEKSTLLFNEIVKGMFLIIIEMFN